MFYEPSFHLPSPMSEDQLLSGALHKLSLNSRRVPHEFCLPTLHTTDDQRSHENPGAGPFWLVTSGLVVGAFTNWCVSEIPIVKSPKLRALCQALGKGPD